MTYKEIFPRVVIRDSEAIKGAVKKGTALFRDAIIEALLDDAYQRGVLAGMDAVLDDPQAYDLVSSDKGGN